ncbi:helix-turn-helix domain-containing protein [methane-oxidizing endosymbiont of Gigantopelta aegis]|uniref:helix-turn-helix domain-containing protein n=1 Tax=methane-oxidizing endosymbiont of Gigantopelta aegis TaxID=2794938 RepID=UPI001FDAACE4|nr:helix-turn-helix transcriptional regulator [methane-oxidizing endosymbiont of Gigantopelta aegis]
MIYNERQFKITSKQIEALKNNLVEIAEEEAAPDWLKEAQISALKSQISDLMAQVTEYELLKEGKIKYTECSDLNVLPKTLIRARISKGLSQKEFAEILGMPQQQIQRYEASNYMGASLSKLINIASVLEVKFTESWSGANYKGADSLFVWDEENAVDWNKFPIKEMLKKGWIDIKNKISPALTVKEFFSNTAGPQFATALHRKKFHGKNTPNEYSLLAWQARIIQKARNTYENHEISEYEFSDHWVKDLVELSVDEKAPLLVKEFLAKKA